MSRQVTYKRFPLHKMSQWTDLPCHLHHVSFQEMSESKWTELMDYLKDLGAHRDDHYIFMVHQEGTSTYMVDFQEYELQGLGLNIILPGQVHEILGVNEMKGWHVAVEAHALDQATVSMLQEIPDQTRWLPLNPGEELSILACLEMMKERLEYKQEQPFNKSILHGLVRAFVGMMAEIYAGRCHHASQKESRSQQVTAQFKTLINQQFKEEKSPAAYATQLHLSPSYLHELVRDATGLSPTHWIQQEVMMEARRLLYYSDLSIKEVGYELGYEDPTYFSRLFRQTVGVSPARFRQHFRE